MLKTCSGGACQHARCLVLRGVAPYHAVLWAACCFLSRSLSVILFSFRRARCLMYGYRTITTYRAGRACAAPYHTVGTMLTLLS